MDLLREGLGFFLMMLVASLNWLILLLFVVGLIKLWEWRKDYLLLVKRVVQLEAQLAEGAASQPGK
jgi:hypothetical protein